MTSYEKGFEMKLSKTYEPKQYEPTVYGLWESSGSFAPTGKGKPYTIVMPPFNANANLHMGHALTLNIQDILIRYYRMKGRDTVYIPGTDHAGFETWVVYERKLAEDGHSRFEFSREELYSQVWDFVEKQRGNIELQVRALGASASWDHLVFTLDEKVITTVYDTFGKLWKDGLIYRGERIVNYCTYHQTSFADIEVEHREEKSKLWYINYPLLERVGSITVATTRPETMLGDTAIAVHPDDDRYKELIGTTVQLPIVGREVPIIADDAIDPSFGTGAVKITPGHDPMDFEIGERHNLPVIQVIGYDGLMTEEAPSHYAGLTIKEARERVLFELNELERLKKEEDYTHTVGHCYKCGTAIQPLVKDQWFLKVKPLAEKAKEAIAAGEIDFTPKTKAKELLSYYDQLRDWNLSRQIPWGIPIPAFQNVHDHSDWIFDTRVDQPEIEVDGKTYKREEDTFDTWFSSGQWPFVTTDYFGDKTLAKHFPNDLMETGSDILKAWVSRMVMLSLYRTGEVPFKDVYLHGMVLDEKGQKMSKSKGNVINPMDILTSYGSDALRLGMIANRSAGQSQAFSTATVVAGRNFCNKLWNMARYIEGAIPLDETRTPHPETIADHWVIRQLDEARKAIDDHLKAYRFSDAADVVYRTIWNDVADWYLEASKEQAGKGMLAWVCDTMLRLAHPFAPFVTETIWTTLKWDEKLLICSAWPKKQEYDEIAAAEFERLQALVTETRYVAGELPGGKQTLLYEHDILIADNEHLIQRLAKLASVEHVVQPSGLRLAVPNREAWLAVDADTLYEHQSKLEIRLVETREAIRRLEARLSNESYVKNAPKKVVEETREQLKDQASLEEKLVAELEVLGA